MPNSSGANVFLTLLKFSLTVITLSYVEDYVAYNGNKGDFRKVIQWLESHSSQTGWHDKSFYDTGKFRNIFLKSRHFYVSIVLKMLASILYKSTSSFHRMTDHPLVDFAALSSPSRSVLSQDGIE